jgi:hypothetical protein
MVENQHIKKPACSRWLGRVLILSSEMSVHIGLHSAVTQEMAAFLIPVLLASREKRDLMFFFYVICLWNSDEKANHEMKITDETEADLN